MIFNFFAIEMSSTLEKVPKTLEFYQNIKLNQLNYKVFFYIFFDLGD